MGSELSQARDGAGLGLAIGFEDVSGAHVEYYGILLVRTMGIRALRGGSGFG